MIEDIIEINELIQMIEEKEYIDCDIYGSDDGKEFFSILFYLKKIKKNILKESKVCDFTSWGDDK